MGVWWIVATVVVGWSVLSVLVGVVLGHLMAGVPLRARPSVTASVRPALEVGPSPVVVFNDVLARSTTFDAAV